MKLKTHPILEKLWQIKDALDREAGHDQECGIKRPYVTVWSWLKKLGGVLRVPWPRHPENDLEAADKFKQELGAKLEALPVPKGS